MEYDLILARSVTYGQRMQKALARAGIRSQIFRAPRDLTDFGCAYTIQVSTQDLLSALIVLRREKLPVTQVFRYQQGVYREVAI